MGHFNMLPHDIMFEIFSRVPVESVLECKLVSKPWRNLLQHSSFYQMHMSHPNNLDSDKLSFIFCTVSDEKPYCYIEYEENLNRFGRTITIDFRPFFKDYRIQGSCNGLICIHAHRDGYYVQPAYICNPITREYIALPESEGKHLLTGFGYSPSVNKYKVVRICEDRGDRNCGIIQVYTLGSGMGWRNLKKVGCPCTYSNQRGLFLNGAIHWVDTNRTIVAFDLADEEFRQLPSLSLHRLPFCFVVLLVLGDFLCACYHHYYGADITCFEIWVLKKKNNNNVTWSKEFRNINVKPIYLTKSCELLWYHCKDKKVYAMKDSYSRKVVNFGKRINDVVAHKNTLVSLSALGEEVTKLMDSGGRAGSSRETEIRGH